MEKHIKRLSVAMEVHNAFTDNQGKKIESRTGRAHETLATSNVPFSSSSSISSSSPSSSSSSSQFSASSLSQGSSNDPESTYSSPSSKQTNMESEKAFRRMSLDKKDRRISEGTILENAVNDLAAKRIILLNKLLENRSREAELLGIKKQIVRCQLFCENSDSADRLQLENLASRVGLARETIKKIDETVQPTQDAIVSRRTMYISACEALNRKHYARGREILEETQQRTALREMLHRDLNTECKSFLRDCFLTPISANDGGEGTVTNQNKNNTPSQSSVDADKILRSFLDSLTVDKDVIESEGHKLIASLEEDISELKMNILGKKHEEEVHPSSISADDGGDDDVDVDFAFDKRVDVASGIKEFELFLAEVLQRCAKKGLDSLSKRYVDSELTYHDGWKGGGADHVPPAASKDVIGDFAFKAKHLEWENAAAHRITERVVADLIADCNAKINTAHLMSEDHQKRLLERIKNTGM